MQKMMMIKLIIFLNFLTAITAYKIWPRPKFMKVEKEFYSIDAKNFEIISKSKCQTLNSAIKRYMSRLFVQDCSMLNDKFSGRYLLNNTDDSMEESNDYIGQLDKIMINFAGKCEAIPKHTMDETYSIVIDKNISFLQSKSVWGALRSLETFSQMLEHVGLNQYKIYLGKINDAPRFKYRGHLLDTSRHYLPLHSILETLDAMEMNKMNVFHWHIVDDQSFPFVSTKFPQLSAKGSYKKDFIYSLEDVDDVLNYAHERGIRVVVEFDTPGHTRSWGKGQKNLLTQCYDAKGKPMPNSFGPINPVLNETYDFIRDLFTEIVERFPDQYLHLGGDEVDFSCWRSNPLIREFMKIKNFGDNYEKLESYYITKLINIVQNLNRSYIVWQEVFDNHVDIRPETVVNVWKGENWQNELKSVTKAAHKAILSACWYLNVISYGVDWYKYYQCDPHNFNGTKQEKNFVIGGSSTMWGEYVDATNVIGRTWPRACAVAERLWSPQSINSYWRARPRFHRQRCRMQLLGLRVEPSEGPDYCQCDNAL